MKAFKKNIYLTISESGCNCVNGEVAIDTQILTCSNSNVSTYRNGDIIPQVTDPIAWSNLTTGAWCYYNNDPLTEAIYGKLYNWYAVNDPRFLAPVGYHMPTDAEWTVLTGFLGGLLVAGGKMKEVGITNWFNPNADATNSSCFTGRPGGARNSYDANFVNISLTGYWWSSSEDDANNAWGRALTSNSGIANRFDYNKRGGFSVRFIKGDTPLSTITIGTQIWTDRNLEVVTYRNGDIIPQVTDPTAWAALTTGAWCYYNNDPANNTKYGKLYNWYAVNDIRGLAPIGYHVPTDAEWTVLVTYLGGSSVAGGAMKEVGLTSWNSPNTGATNTSLFTGLPGGSRNSLGSSNAIGTNGSWWSSTEHTSTTNAWNRNMFHNAGSINNYGYTKTYGLSVRIIKD